MSNILPCGSAEKRIMNAYCDESCHLEHDHVNFMGLGLVSVDSTQVKRISSELKNIKNHHNCRGELKWTKVSAKNIGFYLDLVDYFFSEGALEFRALVVHDKDRLDHDFFNDGSHDLFYYKMYFYLIRNVVQYAFDKQWRIYLDIKDTRSSIKVHELKKVLSSSFRDPEFFLINRIQQIRSHESEILQLTDFLLGAVMYTTRKETRSPAKVAIAKRIHEHAGVNLHVSTAPWEEKFNLFHFKPRKA